MQHVNFLIVLIIVGTWLLVQLSELFHKHFVDVAGFIGRI